MVLVTERKLPTVICPSFTYLYSIVFHCGCNYMTETVGCYQKGKNEYFLSITEMFKPASMSSGGIKALYWSTKHFARSS